LTQILHLSIYVQWFDLKMFYDAYRGFVS